MRRETGPSLLYVKVCVRVGPDLQKAFESLQSLATHSEQLTRQE